MSEEEEVKQNQSQKFQRFRKRSGSNGERARKSLKTLGTQVTEPLRAMVMGAPLEDARHLAQRCDGMRQEAEAQAIEVSKRQA